MMNSDLYPANQDTVAKYETSVVVLEILGKILANRDLAFARDIFKDYFSIHEFVYVIEDNIDALEDCYENENDSDIFEYEHKDLIRE